MAAPNSSDRKPDSDSRLQVASQLVSGVPSDGQTEEKIGEAIVGLLRKHGGRGPTRIRTDLTDEMVVVVARDCHTTPERTLAEKGRGRLVGEIRSSVHEKVCLEARAAIEGLTAREVVVCLSDQQRVPDVAAFVFVFA